MQASHRTTKKWRQRDWTENSRVKTMRIVKKQ